MPKVDQLRLFGQSVFTASVPQDYQPVRPAHFEVARICLAKGSITTPDGGLCAGASWRSDRAAAPMGRAGARRRGAGEGVRSAGDRASLASVR
jgi:hypothetical protein